MPSVQADIDPVSSWITTRHGTYDFYTDQSHNDTDQWYSSFEPWVKLDVFVAGNVSWTMINVATNDTRNGSLVSGVSKEIFLVNGSEIWIIVEVFGDENRTFNFGTMAKATQQAVVSVNVLPPMVALFQALAREWRMLVYTVIVMAVLSPAIYLSVSRIKRGKIIER